MQRTSSAASCAGCGYHSRHGIAVPSSPVPTLLRTHVVPSPSQAKLIQSTLSHVHSTISEIDEEIEEVLTILDLLENKRSDFQEYADRHGALLAPVRRLPPELLAEVFTHCLHSGQGAATMADKKNIMRPSQVCKHWRNVAVSTARLWSSLSFNAHSSNYKSQISLAKLWLSRAGGRLLSIRVKDDSWENHTQRMRLINDIFLPYCNRWQHVEIRGVPWLGISDLAIARSNLPYLETLVLDTCQEPLMVLNTFEFAPNLRTLELGSRIQPHDLRIPWSQLTHLLAKTSIGEWHTVLTLMPHLVTLDAQLAQDSFTHPSIPYPIIRLSQLAKLKLSSSLDFAIFLDYLSLPRLHEFCYECKLHRWHHQQFISFLIRSSCSLRSLNISNTDMDENQLIRILEHTPDLIDLCLGPNGIVLTANLTSQLTYRKAPCLLPKLCSLDICWGLGFDDLGFVDMIDSRWRLAGSTAESGNDTISRIQTVKLRRVNQLNRLDLIRCRRLLVEGLDLLLMKGDSVRLAGYDRSLNLLDQLV